MISRLMTLTTLHGECDQEKMKKIWEASMIRANIPIDANEPPGPDVVAVFRCGDDVLEVRATDWEMAAELSKMFNTEVNISIG